MPRGDSCFNLGLAWLVDIPRFLASLWTGTASRTKEDDPESHLDFRTNNSHDEAASRVQVSPQAQAGSHLTSPRAAKEPLSRSASTRTELDEKISTESPRLVYSTSLDTLRNTTLDLTPYFSDQHFRFIDADAFIHHCTLAIYEMSSLPDLYTVISYVWFGLVAEPSQLEHDGNFRVFCGVHSDGTLHEDGGPISFKVLEYACRWASDSSSSYLWLDRLSILQTSKKDKAWQISHMYDIYECSEQCVVLPGGLQCLASMFDETSWADRAWTYQEAIVTWNYAVVLTRDWHRPKGEQHWLVDGECHWQHLVGLFVEGDDLLTRQTADSGADNLGPCLILGRNGRALNILRRIVEYKTYNEVTSEGEETISNQTISQLVLQGVAMRTSSRPVDMVFSILGLMGIQDAFQGHIHVNDFGEHERFCAMLALVEAVLCLQNDKDDDNDLINPSTLIDVPLWQSLELINIAKPSYKDQSLDIIKLPALDDLAQLLDSDTTEVQLSCHPDILMKCATLSEWAFEVEKTEDEPNKRASTIALEIPDNDLLDIYYGKRDRVLVQHKEEGIINLCQKLTLKSSSKDTIDPVIFGWSLKLDGHPYIRFYKFDISFLIL